MPFAYSNKNAKKAYLRRASLNELCFSQTERLDFETSKFKVLLTTLIHKLFLMQMLIDNVKINNNNKKSKIFKKWEKRKEKRQG